MTATLKAMVTPTNKAVLGLLIVVLVPALLLTACGPDPADPKSPEQILLDKAVAALWGDVSPDSVKSLQTTSMLTETQDDFASTFSLETLLAPNNCYREIRSWAEFDLKEEFIQGKDKSWRKVDGTVVEVLERPEDAPAQSRQSWLFEVSKLNALKDTKRFKLDHLGEHESEEGKKIERLEVLDRNRPGLKLTLDFTMSTWLIERVTLEDDSSNSTFTLSLKNYKAVDGVQFAHEIDSFQDGKPHAQQRKITYKLNPTNNPAVFEAPVDLNRDALFTKNSIGGTFATMKLGENEVADAVENLKSWIAENKLEVVGPLVVIRPSATLADESKPKVNTTRVAIAIKDPSAEAKKAIEKSEEFALENVTSCKALCLTEVGENQFAAIRTRMAERSGSNGLKDGAEAFEIYFSPEGTIRQIQIPVR